MKKGEFSMKIEIIGAESLGVRGLCCLVTVAERKILIDPGLALGFLRNGQAPHPVQVAMGEVIRKQIIQVWGLATDIVFSHFHGDHVPLVDANPYQLDAALVTGPGKTQCGWPVPLEWHQQYAQGKAATEKYERIFFG